MLELLEEIKKFSGERVTQGLSTKAIERFLKIDPRLQQVIEEAHWIRQNLKTEFSEVLKLPELEQVTKLQKDYVNFYHQDTINPYVPLAARGPWIVTTCGAVIHDSGGYGMLGHGHNPQKLLDTLSQPHVMANIMTASFSQKRLRDRLNKEIGRTRRGSLRKPYGNYLVMNSGSESVTVALRIADAMAYNLTRPGAIHDGKEIKLLSIRGGFHGRTDRPAQASDSSQKTYRENLASFANRQNLVSVEMNNTEELEKAFKEADANGVFFEAMLAEPVMGEGNPGYAMTAEFYTKARELCTRYSTLLIIDSIQAGLRCFGCLSVCDYPGFSELSPPDMETFSKALNGGMYPMSVLAMGNGPASSYVRGTYGNTMTANPKAAEIGCKILESLTPELRKNIVDRGREFLDKFKKLQSKFPDVIVKVQGTGLLFSIEINKDCFQVVGADGLENHLRKNGIGIIHGGENSLRLTPTFRVTSEEIDLIVEVISHALVNAPRVNTLSA